MNKLLLLFLIIHNVTWKIVMSQNKVQNKVYQKYWLFIRVQLDFDGHKQLQ